MSSRETNLALALIAGIAVLAGPRRSRPLSGFLYGLLLSRAQGSRAARLERTLLRLFDERESVRRDVERIREAQRVDAEHFYNHLEAHHQ